MFINFDYVMKMLPMEIEIPVSKTYLNFFQATIFLGITFSYYVYMDYVMPFTRRIMVLFGYPEWLLMPDYLYKRFCSSIWSLWWSFILSFNAQGLIGQDMTLLEARKDVTVLFTFHTVYLAHQVWLYTCKREISVTLFQIVLLMLFSCSSLFWRPYFGILFLVMVFGVNTLLSIARVAWCLQALNVIRPIGVACWLSTILYSTLWLVAYIIALPNLIEKLFNHVTESQSLFNLPLHEIYGFAIGAAFILIEIISMPTLKWCSILFDEAHNIFQLRSLERLMYAGEGRRL